MRDSVLQALTINNRKNNEMIISFLEKMPELINLNQSQSDTFQKAFEELKKNLR